MVQFENVPHRLVEAHSKHISVAPLKYIMKDAERSLFAPHKKEYFSRVSAYSPALLLHSLWKEQKNRKILLAFVRERVGEKMECSALLLASASSNVVQFSTVDKRAQFSLSHRLPVALAYLPSFALQPSSSQHSFSSQLYSSLVASIQHFLVHAIVAILLFTCIFAVVAERNLSFCCFICFASFPI